MAEYRAYAVGIDGHFVSFEALVCVDDVEAIDKAKRLIDGHDIEALARRPLGHPAKSHDRVGPPNISRHRDAPRHTA